MSPLMSCIMVLAMAARVIALMPVSLHGDRSRTSQPRNCGNKITSHPLNLGNDPLAARRP